MRIVAVGDLSTDLYVLSAAVSAFFQLIRKFISPLIFVIYLNSSYFRWNFMDSVKYTFHNSPLITQFTDISLVSTNYLS